MADDVTHYQVDDVAVLDATFEVDDVPTDPDTVTFKVRKPDNTVQTYVWQTDDEVGRTGPGVYFAEVPVDQAGYWRYQGKGVGTAPGVADGLFIGDPDPFSPDYVEATRRRLCTLEEVKAYAGEDLSDHDQDLIWERLIDDCAEAFYTYTDREFTPMVDNPFERVFDVRDYEVDERRVAIGDLASLTGLTIYGSLYDGSPVITTGYNGVIPAASVVGLPRNRKPWQPITELWFPRWNIAWPAVLQRHSTLTIAGDWGFPKVPGDVRQMAIVQVSIWFERDVAKFSGSFNLEEGRTLRPRMLDDAIRDGLDAYREPSIG